MITFAFGTLAFLGGSVGTGEWIVLFVVVLIAVGPKRLPEVARKIGRMMNTVRRAADDFKAQVMTMDQPPPPEPYVDISPDEANVVPAPYEDQPAEPPPASEDAL